MTDKEVKIWVRGIFEKKNPLPRKMKLNYHQKPLKF
jgi:hypothetical protein